MVEEQAKLESQFDGAKLENTSLTKKVSDLTDETDQLKHQLVSISLQQTELIKSLTEKQDQQTQDLLAQKASENDRLSSEIASLKDHISTLNKEKEDLIAKLADARQEQEQLNYELSRQIDEIKGQTDSLAAKKQKELESMKAEFEA